MELKEISRLFMVLVITGCGGLVKISDETTTRSVCTTDYNETHEAIVDVTNVEFTDATTGESIVDGNLLSFHRFTTLENEPADTWEIFVSLENKNLFALNTNFNVPDVTSETSLSGFNSRLYNMDKSFSFDNLLECMEITEESFYTGCEDFLPTEYSTYGLSPRNITPTGENIFRFEGGYGYYETANSGDDTFKGFYINFDIITDTVGLEIDYPAYSQTCQLMVYQYDCDIHSYKDYFCPEGYEMHIYSEGFDEESEECHNAGSIYCTKCTVEDENGQVVLDGSPAIEIDEETRDSLCEGTKNENWDTLIDLSEEKSH